MFDTITSFSPSPWSSQYDGATGKYKVSSSSLGTDEQYLFETKEWAQMCAAHFNRLEYAKYSTVNLSANGNYIVSNENTPYQFTTGQSSEWECELFGTGKLFVLNPTVDQVPNWFWRKMQYLCFGNKWVKKTK